MTKRISILTALGFTLAAILAAAILVAVYAGHTTARASGIQLSQCNNVTGMGGGPANATTTPVYSGVGLTGATSTMASCNMQHASSFSLHVRNNASSTSSTFLWVVQASMDGIDWYNLDRDEALSAGVVTHQGTTTDTFTPAVPGVNAIDYVYPTFGSNYVRLLYSAAVASSSNLITLVPNNNAGN